jgi:hypothetical protein
MLQLPTRFVPTTQLDVVAAVPVPDVLELPVVSADPLDAQATKKDTIPKIKKNVIFFMFPSILDVVTVIATVYIKGVVSANFFLYYFNQFKIRGLLQYR